MKKDWDFRKDLKNYMTITKMSKTTIGRLVFKDPRWYLDVVLERDVTRRRNPRKPALIKLHQYLTDVGYFSNPDELGIYIARGNTEITTN